MNLQKTVTHVNELFTTEVVTNKHDYIYNGFSFVSLKTTYMNYEYQIV